MDVGGGGGPPHRVRPSPSGGVAAPLGGWARWAAPIWTLHQMYDTTPPFSDQRVLALNHCPVIEALDGEVGTPRYLLYTIEEVP
jgi:hypothetical protein